MKYAGRTRAEFVEKLYDYFDIDTETTERRDKGGEVVRGKDGRPVEVKIDKNKAVRIQKLAEAFAQLVDGQDKVEKAGPTADEPESDEGVDAPVSTVSAPDSQTSYEHRFSRDAA